MVEIRSTTHFDAWARSLRDPIAKAAVARRIGRLRDGNRGDAKLVGEGVVEMRIDTGPGYRIYYARHEDVLVLLLCGGDKATQTGDISRAKELAKAWRMERGNWT